MDKIIHFSFNQDASCFVCANSKGFRIFNSNSFEEIYRNDIGGGLKQISMFYTSNLMVFIGGGNFPKFPPTKVILWNDERKQIVGELCFKTNVLDVKFRKERLVAILYKKIHLYNFTDFNLLETIETIPNPNACCALTGTGPIILATPSTNLGELIINDYTKNHKEKMIANKSGISFIILSDDGELCAIASNKGTLIRIFMTENGKLLQELRRGKDSAKITSMAFDRTRRWISCSSNTGTVHIFSVMMPVKADLAESIPVRMSESDLDLNVEDSKENEDSKDIPRNKTSIFKFMGGMISYFKSEWSISQFRIPEKNSIVGFIPDETNKVSIVTSTGKCYLVEYVPAIPGECKKINEKIIELTK